MSKPSGSPRRAFLKGAAFAAGAAGQTPTPSLPAEAPPAASAVKPRSETIAYPRVFTGEHLSMLAFPLGGVAAGSVALGGRGQLRDWEMFNRPNKGYRPAYCFPSIWVRAGNAKPVARVLESQLLPPFEGQNGLGSENAPGLSRLKSARFTGEYPLAHIDFIDSDLPVAVSLDAFSPIIPHDPDESGLPVAVLRYRVRNTSRAARTVSIAFSLDNMITPEERPRGSAEPPPPDKRQNEFRRSGAFAGLLMSNPGLAAEDPMRGTLAFGFLDAPEDALTWWRGWPRSRWWNPPMLFWDDFSDDGRLGPEPDSRMTVGSICLQRVIDPGKSSDYTMVLAWHFPNRTPQWCGWSAPKGSERTIIGNYYCTRFPSAWEAAEYTAANLSRLESRTRQFAATIRESTLPPAIKDAAMSNVSTLATTTCFRTADGEFHGFEGANDKRGCCFGNCTHVWNYETTTPYLFPSFARSLRKAAFGYSMDDAGAIHFRQLLPDGKQRSGFAAADGQMGQIIHAYMDWIASGDDRWLREIWPRVKKALEFAWVPGGWDADRDGVLEGVQHNTYDVEFFGPNPQCGIFYLGALRAGEEMARAVGDSSSAQEYRRLFERGRQWIDANLFNGEFYVQKVRGFRKDEIAPALRSSMGADDTEKPEYQLGEGCLVDQLMGQYLADVAGLGPLLDPKNLNTAIQSIYKYNYRRSLDHHDSVQRTYALNDEAGILVCDYGKAERPRIPFPYYAEVWTGFEYMASSQMIFAGMVRQGLECVTSTRMRHDGHRRNPWDEPECGHHYARAMSAWSCLVAASGFHYDGHKATVVVLPRLSAPKFRSFWASGTGWGTFDSTAAGLSLRVLSGTLPCASCEIRGSGKSAAVLANGKTMTNKVEARGSHSVVTFDRITLSEGQELNITFSR